MSFSIEDEVDFDADDRTRDNAEFGDDPLLDYGELFDEEDFVALGINPSEPTDAKPGSDAKVMMLAARYAAGLPLWHESDCYDHGPNSGADGEDEFANSGGEEDEDFV